MSVAYTPSKGGGIDPRMSEERASQNRRFPRPLLIGVVAFLIIALVTVVMGLSRAWTNWIVLGGGSGEELDPRPLLICTALVLGALALLLTGWLWAILFKVSGGRTRTSEAAAAWLGSNLGRYLPGKVWQLTSIAAYLAARGDTGSIAFTVSLALQAVMLAVGALIGVGILGPLVFSALNPWVFVIGGSGVLIALHPTVLRWVTRFVRRVLKEDRTGDRADNSKVLVSDGITARSIFIAAVVAVLIWSLYGAGFWVLVASLFTEHGITFPMATAVFATGYVVGYMAIIAPGGLVVREGAIIGLLGMVAGMPLSSATIIALAARVWTTAAEVLALGLAIAFGLRKSPHLR
jgi:hypothetical protein